MRLRFRGWYSPHRDFTDRHTKVVRRSGKYIWICRPTHESWCGMNAAKCKIMVSDCWKDSIVVRAEGAKIEVVEDFCYLGSHISNNGNCDKEYSTRLGKASSVFSRLTNIWRNKDINLTTKVRLYELLVLSTLLYSADLWPLSVTQTKKLEAAHHKFQRRLLWISWRTKWKMMISERKRAWGNSKT